MSSPRNLSLYQPENYYQEDAFLQRLLRATLPTAELAWAQAYLSEMGRISAQEFSSLALVADRRRPEHIPYDATGKRIDTIEYDGSYLRMAKRIYEFGIVGLGESEEFKKNKRSYGPLLKFALGYLFSQSGSVLYCPICMTDGTVQVLKRHASESMKQLWLPRLQNLNYENFYDGAMYLTEVQGGSDVGSNTCEAYQENGTWKLTGEKWFCSNIGSKTALVLARPRGAAPGTEGLGLFLVPRDLENGERNAILVHRIKNKLGTCEMATGEVSLQGAVAEPVGDLQQGFAYMTDMLNLSRIYNAVWSIGLMRRALLEAKHYAATRQAFGKPIQDFPLVAQSLHQMEINSEKALSLVFATLTYYDKVESHSGTANDKTLLRLLTPVIKVYTAEKAIESAHAAIEIFGGNGCVEDFPVAKLLRDAQILAIWEGTANILSLDLLRVLKKEQAAPLLLATLEEKIKRSPPTVQATLRASYQDFQKLLEATLQGHDGCGGKLSCRPLLTALAEQMQTLAWHQLAQVH